MYQDVTIYIPSYDNGDEYSDHRHGIGVRAYETLEEAEKELFDRGYAVNEPHKEGDEPHYAYTVDEFGNQEYLLEYTSDVYLKKVRKTIYDEMAFATIRKITLRRGVYDETKSKEA